MGNDAKKKRRVLGGNSADAVHSVSAFGRNLVGPRIVGQSERSVPTDVIERKPPMTDPSIHSNSSPDDDVRMAFRKPGLFAVMGLRVPAKPIWISGMLLLGTIAALAWDSTRQPAAPSEAALSTMQWATINSRPEGIAVSIDGMVRGTTPLKLPLSVGEHLLKVQKGTNSRSIPITVEQGTAVAQFIDFGEDQSAPLPAPAGVTSNPPAGAQIERAASEKTPRVSATPAGGAAVAQAATTPAVATQNAGTPTPSFGWLSITSPMELQIIENGRVIGTTIADRVMVLAGRHELELRSPTLAFRSSLVVQVAPGKVVTRTVTAPNGSLSLNAQPWANVILDGKALGETPLANIPVTIGQHEVVWQHPQLGERRQSVLVTAGAPVRVGVDLRK